MIHKNDHTVPIRILLHQLSSQTQMQVLDEL